GLPRLTHVVGSLSGGIFWNLGFHVALPAPATPTIFATAGVAEEQIRLTQIHRNARVVALRAQPALRHSYHSILNDVGISNRDASRPSPKQSIQGPKDLRRTVHRRSFARRLARVGERRSRNAQLVLLIF